MVDFKEAFRIDFKRRKPMEERFMAKKVELAAVAQEKDLEDLESKTKTHHEGENNGSTKEGHVEMTHASTLGHSTKSTFKDEGVETTTATTPIPRPSGGGNRGSTNVSAAAAEEELTELKIEFVLKLCQAQMASGQSTVDTEMHATNAAIALGMDPPALDIGPRVMHAALYHNAKNAFDRHNHTPYFVPTSRDIVLCKLQDVTWVAKLVALKGESYRNNRYDIIALMSLLDDIMAEPLPYGWFIQDVLFVWLSVMATIGAFFGSYKDMLIVFIISSVIVGIQKVVRCFPAVLGPMELILVTGCSSLLTAAAFRISYDAGYDEDRICNVPVIYLSPLLVYLPGSELIYGAYEMQMGHMTVGASRLVHALTKCMMMACGLTIGWQFTGYNFAHWYYHEIDAAYDNTTSSTATVIALGAEASYVPASKCVPFVESWNVGPWWIVFGCWNLVMLFPVLGGLQVRPIDFPSHYIIAYVSLIIFGALNFQPPVNGLPSFVVNIIGLFVATNFACFKEYVTGVPAVTSIIPVLLVLAPGSVVVLMLLTMMQISSSVSNASENTYGATDIASYLWLLGVTYSLGMYLALSIWKPALLKHEIKSQNLLDLVKKQNRKRASIDMIGKNL